MSITVRCRRLIQQVVQCGSPVKYRATFQVKNPQSRYFADLRSPDLQALLDAPLQAVPRVQAFQREVPARFSLKAMGQAWLDCLSGTV